METVKERHTQKGVHIMKEAKRYKINTAYPVNKSASKNGIKWEYSGRKTDKEAEETKISFEENITRWVELCKSGYCVPLGLRITDTVTGEVIYEKLYECERGTWKGYSE